VGRRAGLHFLLFVVALPVVVDVTSGRFLPFDFGRQQAQTIVLANL
jgi:hypothetical protein